MCIRHSLVVPLILVWCFMALFDAHSVLAQRRVDVASAASLMAAFADAQPGDDIVLADGRYNLVRKITTMAAGTASAPIVVRAETPGMALVRFDSEGAAVEGFHVRHAYWTFADLRVEGVCADHSACEHAWHIVRDASHTIVRNNVAFGFNAHVKGNGGDGTFPNDVLIEGNEFYGESPRMTANPVTPIDVVGGQRWILRANYIHDFEKGGGDHISYAAFLKGAGRDGIIERNLVQCARDFEGGTRVGLSFGGGGSNPGRVCEGGDCSIEHFGGIMRNNIVLGCSDVGIYINECEACTIAHNTLYQTSGIDFRFDVTSVTAFGNLHSGRMRDRNGASSTQMGNLELSDAEFAAIFTDPMNADFGLVDGARIIDVGLAQPLVQDDYCGALRDDGMNDLGAVEFGSEPCNTTETHSGSDAPPAGDAGVGADAGADAGGGADTGIGADGGTASDAGTIANDGGADADMIGPVDESGCSCRLAGTSNVPGWPSLLVLIGLVMAIRRRR